MVDQGRVASSPVGELAHCATVVLDEVVDGGVWARVRDGLSGLLQ